MDHLIQKEIDLKKFTHWKVGGQAQFFASPETVEEIQFCISWAYKNQLPLTYLGQGSNVLVSDKGIKGLVLCTKRMQGLEILSEDNDLRIFCQAGVLKYKLMRLFLKYKLNPAFFLSGIPGDVGGGIVMNAGISENFKPREFVEIVESFDVLKWKENHNKLEFEVKTYKVDDITWSYRHCSGWQPGFIISAILKWPMQENLEIADQVKQAMDTRRLKQPLDKPSCGSVFVNPPHHKSGALIESCGLKGFSIGGAQVSNKHANFIVNTGNATASDVHQVITHVKNTVLKEHQIELHTEVVYLGDWS